MSFLRRLAVHLLWKGLNSPKRQSPRGVISAVQKRAGTTFGTDSAAGAARQPVKNTGFTLLGAPSRLICQAEMPKP